MRVRYRGYIERQERTAAQSAALEQVTLPSAMWDSDLPGLSSEAREKLRRWRPGTLGQASRIAGVSPSDVAVLAVLVKRWDAAAARAVRAARGDGAANAGAADLGSA